MKDVDQNEVLKLLDVGIIYTVADGKWVSPTELVPKKSGVPVIKNDNDELIPTRVTAGWRVCIDRNSTHTHEKIIFHSHLLIKSWKEWWVTYSIISLTVIQGYFRG